MAVVTQRFRYRIVRNDGAVEMGAAAAESRTALAAQLVAHGAMPLEITPDSHGANQGNLLPLREQALGLRTLATLLGSGLPLAKALGAFQELAPPKWQTGLDEMREAVRQGRTFAGALEDSSIGLPSIVIGVIRAGETAGRLSGAVGAAAEMTEFQAASRATLHSAVAYPLVLGAASFASTALLFGVVVPRFAAALAEVGTSLPRSTKALITMAAWAKAAMVPALLASGAVLAAWRAWVATARGRLRWDRWLLSIPIAGEIRRAAATARLCDALFALLQSGVPLPAALWHATSSLANAHLAAGLAAARGAVLEGRTLSHALSTHNVVTSTAVRLVRAGEESGDIAPMLGHAARLESARVEQLMKGALRLVEPTLILVFGCLVAGIAAALLQALYSVRPAA